MKYYTSKHENTTTKDTKATKDSKEYQFFL
jgi:hypothetical protein